MVTKLDGDVAGAPGARFLGPVLLRNTCLDTLNLRNTEVWERGTRGGRNGVREGGGGVGGGGGWGGACLILHVCE